MATAKKGPKKSSSETKTGATAAKPEGSAKKPQVPEDAAARVDVEGFSDSIRLGNESGALFAKAAGLAVICLAASIGLGASEGDDLKRWSHGYLAAFGVGLAVTAGSVFWVTLQNLVNARWSIVVRRIGEVFAANAPLLGVLSLPLVVPVMMGKPVVYLWADKAMVAADHALEHKAGYLNPGFFLVRMLVYFGFWTWLSRFYLSRSRRQDETGGPELVPAMARISGPAMIVFALTVTFCAIDLIMSVQPRWFSTMFGVYFFASCVLSVHVTLILSLMWLQQKGRLAKSVTAEHYHDLGKMLFAFTIFWAYIGFSQFMLIWYANLPEETAWFKQRFAGGWGNVSWTLLFGHFVIPFFGLLSRHIKRNKTTLAFWCFWMLAMVYIDMYWLVLPAIDVEPDLRPMDLLALVGILSALVAGAAREAGKKNLIPTKDPRLEQSLAFENL
ncbi:MAG TPA: hypothetical protein VMI75_19185 [Polyangiaceae bacterium]|nr:hypothetical protein [Polyangiaceae bacterium]